MLCKGGCNNEAQFGKWCVNPYNKCPGYKKKLSNSAKKRSIVFPGAYGRYTLTKEYNLLCCICNNEFKKKMMEATYLRKEKDKFICVECRKSTIKERQSKSLSLTHQRKRKELPYYKLSVVFRKEICWLEQGQKCNHCGFNKYDLFNGPYELHHKDGINGNNIRDNEEILCCNCHAMTNTDRFKGRHHSEETRQLISLKANEYYNKKRLLNS